MSSPLRIEKDNIEKARVGKSDKAERVEAGETAQAAPEAPKPETRIKSGRVRKPVILSILALLVVAGAIFATRTVIFYRHHETTDDAQIDGTVDPVLTRVTGYVEQIPVKENQPVKPGDLLLRIDTRDLQAKVDQEQAALLNAQAAVPVARAAVASARAQLAGARAKIATSKADVTVARTRQEQTAADLARYQALVAKEEVSRQQYDAARAAADAARSQADAARATTESSSATAESAAAQLAAAERQVTAAEAQVAQHQATLEAARLQLSYAVLRAPVAGAIAKKNVEVGQLVQAGQPLMAIVESARPWVVANFKETQLAKMRVGQPVAVEVDAYPDHTFHARVDSLSAATGARFALLPPDNATGNFTKVVQRVPVKIVFTDPPDEQRPLRVGMNVSVVVSVG